MGARAFVDADGLESSMLPLIANETLAFWVWGPRMTHDQVLGSLRLPAEPVAPVLDRRRVTRREGLA
jgi:hypothetical protein